MRSFNIQTLISPIQRYLTLYLVWHSLYTRSARQPSCRRHRTRPMSTLI